MLKFILIDKKLKKNKFKYIFQCFLATVTILAVLIFLDALSEAALITALGASAFIIFTMPHQYMSDSRRIIGGYIVGFIVGFIFYLFTIVEIFNHVIRSHTISLVMFGSLAVGFAIFIMVITNTEHAPVAGVTLGIIINKWDYLTIIFIIIAVIWMISVKVILKKYMIDLISPS